MPLKLLPPSFSLNLRTHRKLLITDRNRVFAGGMNIGDRQLVNGPSPHRASDLHFSLVGPVAADCVELFAQDWAFSKGGALQTDMATLAWHGQAEARLISDGPDENLDSLLLVIMGVIARAKKRVWIMSPYFLPEPKFQAALCTAALAGVDIKIMIPQENNWPVVQWALQHNMGALLNCGIEIFQRPPPFAHSKCLLADDDYVLVGSSNLDPRSLRLNFELGIEIFDRDINRQLADHFSQVLAGCRRWSIQRLRARRTFTRLRDATAALFSPYL
jgi:cardiolipin synthase